jgi:hypothetical protein
MSRVRMNAFLGGTDSGCRDSQGLCHIGPRAAAPASVRTPHRKTPIGAEPGGTPSQV